MSGDSVMFRSVQAIQRFLQLLVSVQHSRHCVSDSPRQFSADVRTAIRVDGGAGAWEARGADFEIGGARIQNI